MAAAMPDTDAIVIGAGISGMYQLYRLRELGLRVRVFEAGTGVGGTWYWNRYPGARFDSESYSYQYSFSPELLEEWNWSEHFAGQPETLRYLNHVADKFDLRRDIQFRSRVTAAHWQDDARAWDVTLEDGSSASRPLPHHRHRPAVGADDAAHRGRRHASRASPSTPRAGRTSRSSFAGKRVAVIGTGATGVQTIAEVAKTAGHLTVFQRTPNWCKPLHNGPIDAETQVRIKASYPEMFRRCQETFACFIHTTDPRGTFEVTPEEREAFFEQQYATPGFAMWQGNFRDMLTNREANALVSDFVARKIRERVKDPKVADKLIPKDHGFGTRRVPMETSYYEVYNQPNVQLVDIKETPIERITPTGIKTSDADYEFDIIIYATGFDAITGSFDRIDIRGLDGLKLKDKWAGGPQTFLGVQVESFPNMFMLVGPHTALGNIPRSIEYNVDWVTGLIRHMREPQPDARRCPARGRRRLDRLRARDVPGPAHQRGQFLDDRRQSQRRGQADPHARALQRQRPRLPQWCDEVAAKGYREIALD